MLFSSKLHKVQSRSASLWCTFPHLFSSHGTQLFKSLWFPGRPALPRGHQSLSPLCNIKTRYLECSAQNQRFQVFCLSPFKQDATPKSAPVLARGIVTRTCSPETVYAQDWPLISPLRSLVSVSPGILGRFTMSTSDMNEMASHAQSKGSVKETELVVYQESKQRSGCLAGWEVAGESI